MRYSSLLLSLLSAPLFLACIASSDGEGDLEGSGGQVDSSAGGETSSGGGSGGGDTTASGGSGAGTSASGGSDNASGGAPTTDPNDPTVGCTPGAGELSDLGDGTVFDPATCLMWEKEPFLSSEVAGGTTGIEHVGACSGRSTGGRDDWRGPDLAELATLLSGCGTWNNDSYWRPEVSITGASYPDFWTITDGNDATHTCMIEGAKGTSAGGRRADSNVHARCVRGQSSVTGTRTSCDLTCAP